MKVEAMVKLGNKSNDDTIDALKHVPKLNKLLEASSDLFTPPEKVYGSGI